MRIKLFFLGLLFCSGIYGAGNLYATDYPVNTGAELNSALSSSVSGDSVTVTADILMPENATSVSGKNIIIRNDSISRTIAGNGFSGFNFSAANVTLSGLNLTLFNGGALSSNNAVVNLNNVSFTSNTSDFGGAMNIAELNTLNLSGNITFSSNTSTGDLGSAIFNSGAINTSTDSFVLFEYNKPVTPAASPTFNGGGAIFNGGIITLASATFNFNSASQGGAIFNLESSTDTPQTTVNLINVLFSSNSASRFGGAIANADDSIVNITGNVIFSGNQAGQGGAIYNGEIFTPTSTSTIISSEGSYVLFASNIAISSGGAIYNMKAVSLASATFILNSAASGGAIYNTGPGAVSNLGAVSFTSNSATASSGNVGGGAIFNTGRAIVNITTSAAFTGNTAFSGGAIYNALNSTITAVTGSAVAFTSNTASGIAANSGGGAIYNQGTVNLSSAVFNSNSSTRGGALYNDASGVIISTGISSQILFTSNTAFSGGAIYNLGRIELASSTFAFNKASVDSSGGAIYSTAGNVNLINTSLFIGNSANTGGAIFNSASSLITAGSGSFVMFTSNTALTTTIGGGAIHNSGIITLSSSAFNLNTSNLNGGAIYNSGTSAVVNLATAAFISNTAKAASGNVGGGAIYNTSSGRINISGAVVFDSNTALNGGAIYNSGGVITSSAGSSVLFANNKSSATFSMQGGGAIYNNSIVTLSSAAFRGNSTTYRGGAIYNTGFPSILSLTDVEFTSNTSVNEGGAIYTNNGRINMSGLMNFRGNASSTLGGALYLDSSTVLVSSGAVFRFTSNSAATGGAVNNSGVLNFTSAEFTSNSASNQGGAIHNNASTTLSSASFNMNSAISGGAVYNFTTASILNLGDVSFTSNTAANTGGAIYNFAGLVNIGAQAVFSANTAINGGAIYNDRNALIISTGAGSAAMFELNRSTSSGGAIYNLGTVTLDSATFRFNTVNNVAGGAIYSDGVGATVNLKSVLFSSNSSLNTSFGGGAIYNQSGSIINITGSTVFNGNTGFRGGAIYNNTNSVITSTVTGSSVLFTLNRSTSTGGAIYNAGTVLLDSATFYQNRSGGGGAFYNNGTTAVVNLADIIFASNTASSGGGIYNTGSGKIYFDKQSLFTGNTSSVGGGAIYNNTNSVISSTASGSLIVFTSNTVTSTVTGSGFGGAVYNAGTVNLGSVIFDANTAGNNGGAIYNLFTLNFESATFTGNSSGNNGGAISNSGDIAPSLPAAINFTNALFSSNTAANNGGAIYNVHGSSLIATGSVSFISNKVISLTGLGGAIYNSGTVTFDSTTFISNSASNGGAIYMVSNSFLNLKDALFTLNKATSDGGALYNGSAGIINFGQGNIVFSSNSARNGGAIFTSGKITSVQGSHILFTSNTASNDGGAVCNLGQSITFDSSTFISNSVTSYGGALYNAIEGTVNFKNSAFILNVSSLVGGAVYNGGGSINFTDSVVFDRNFAKSSGGAIENSGSGSIININGNAVFTANSSIIGGAIKNTGIVNISSATFAGNTATINGGAIYGHVSNSEITLNNVIFNQNSAGNYGGAIFITNIGKANITGAVRFTSNTASSGGAIYNDLISVITSTASGSSVLFALNTATGTSAASGGGAIYNRGMITLLSSTFNANTASTGGALYAATGSTITFGTSTFTSNRATTGNGGAIYSNIGSLVTFNGISSFTGNSAQVNGGALYLQQATTTFSGAVIFTSNSAVTGSGGAVFNFAGSSLNFANASFISNTAALSGGAIYAQNALAMNFSGNTLFDNNISSGSVGNGGGAIFGWGTSLIFGGTTTFNKNRSVSSGGAVYLTSSANMSFSDVIFTSNTSVNGSGGAIYGLPGTNVSFNGTSLFVGNVASAAGGALLLGNAVAAFTGAVNFTSNTVTGGHGGAISAFTQEYIFNDSAIFNWNEASSSQGGAISAQDAVFRFNKISSFMGNRAFLGGAIFGDANASVNFNGAAAFTGNSAQINGGALYLQQATTTFQGSATFTSNMAITGSGGAIYSNFAGQQYNFNSTANFIGNTAGVCGGAVFASGANFAFAANSIFDNNSAGTGGAFYLSRSTATFAGVSFTNNKATSTVSGYGGAVYGSTDSYVYFNGVSTFSANSAQIDGGALYLLQATTTFNNSASFTNNTAVTGDGGAVHSSVSNKVFDFNANVMFDGNGALNGKGGAVFGEETAFKFMGVSNFVRNKAGNGGALYLKNSTVTFAAVNFINNEAVSGSGGAIYADPDPVWLYFNGALLFSGNKALINGGAIYAPETDIIFPQSVIFTSNTATTGNGGAIYVSSQSYIFTNTAMFIGNKAGQKGGAIFLDKTVMTFANIARFIGNSANEGGAMYAQNGSTVTYNNNVYFDGNQATLNGGAVYVGSNSVVNMTNPEFRNNAAGTAGGAVYMNGEAGNEAVLNIEQTIDTVISGNSAGGESNVFHLEEYARLNWDIEASTTIAQDRITSKNTDTIITKTGSGVLDLESAENAINGRLNIYEGRVMTGYATGTGDIYFESGIFNLTRDVTLENNMYATASASTITVEVDTPTATTLNGTIGNGVGSFVKSGMGSLVFNTVSTANVESVEVRAGELKVMTNNFVSPVVMVNSGALLSGLGSVTGNVFNNGVVRPGTTAEIGVLTINGNYAENGNLGIRIEESNIPTNDLLRVNGTATIGASSLIDLDLRNGFVVNSSYTVLQSLGRAGTYAGFTSSFTSIDIRIVTDLNNVYLRVGGVETHYGDIRPMSHNQGEVARTLDKITARDIDEDTNKITKIIGTADPLDADGKRAVFDEIAGSVYGNAMLVSAQNNGSRQAYGQIEEKINRNASRQEKTPCTYNVWGQVYGTYMEMKHDSNSVNDFKDKSGYIMTGFDNYCGVKNAILGYMVGFGRHTATQNKDRVDINDYKAGVYFGAFGDKWTLKTSASGGYQQYESKREQEILQSETSAVYDGFTVTGDVEAYYAVYKKESFKVSPFAGLEGSYIITKDFKEDGDENTAAYLTVEDNRFAIVDSKFGVRAESKIEIVNIYGELSGRYNLKGSKGKFKASLNGIDEEMEIYGASNNLFSGQAEIGVDIEVSEHLNVYVTGTHEQAVKFNQTSAILGVNYSW